MNWAGASVVIGLIGLAFFTMPFGIIILLGLTWVFSKDSFSILRGEKEGGPTQSPSPIDALPKEPNVRSLTAAPSGNIASPHLPIQRSANSAPTKVVGENENGTSTGLILKEHDPQALQMSQYAARILTEADPPKSPAFNSSESRRILRKRTKVFDPAHYQRHAGVPGFLYIARNDSYQVGLFKMGYTTAPSPDARIKSLNSQHAKASDVGNFSLIHSAPVKGSYDAEKALFDVIAKVAGERIRVVDKREFFFQRTDFLIRAVKAASAFNNDNPGALDEFLEWALGQDSWQRLAPAFSQPVDIPPRLLATDAWIYVFHNRWHRDSIFRVVVTKRSPLKALEKLNDVQRDLTCQIGFYALVSCIVVDDSRKLRTSISSSLRKYQIDESGDFFDIPFATLTALLTGTVDETNRKEATASFKVPRSRSGWMDCPNCLSSIQLKSKESPECPECHWSAE
jgi:hypothetical protein